jgi:hypothetical protein
MTEKRTVNSVLESLKKLVENKSGMPVNKETWLNAAFTLELLRPDETILLNKMRQEIAKKKLEILKGQSKKNVAAAEIEIETLDEYRIMKDQEDLIETLDEFVKISKKNAETGY